METNDMAKADIETITNPDASLFKKIGCVADLWRQTLLLDEAQRTARRQGNLSEKKELEARHDQLVDSICSLEWEVVYTHAVTAEGHAAKIQMVAGSSFDPEDLIEIAWAFGHEAGRLGLGSEMPRLEPAEAERVAAAA
jgi:hypothetical protein